MRLAFMGTPDFAVPTLDALLEAGHDIAAVYTQPPRPAGRGHKERRSPVHRAAAEQDLPVRTPASLKPVEVREAFAALDLDAAVVVAYGLILPRAILDAPRLGCLNVHASLLPRWRGAAPIQRAILAGDPETGVTIMRMAPGLDTGPILLTGSVPIGPTTTAADLHDTLAARGAALINPALDGLAAGTLTARSQPEEGVTYARKVDREDGRLIWGSAADVDRQVRALVPWPGVWCSWDDRMLKVHAVEILDRATDQPGGTVVDDRLAVACADGSAVRLTRVQRPGKAPMRADALLRGTPVPAGTRLI